MRFKFDSYSSLGAVLTAAACPMCFPALAAVGTIIGMEALAGYENYLVWGVQFFILLSAVGLLCDFDAHQSTMLVCLSVVSAVLLLVSLHLVYSEGLAYVALAGMVAGSAGSMMIQRNPRHQPSWIP
jgi:mercuric ion transport protein